jgi:carboxyl-terminal processing protease
VAAEVYTEIKSKYVEDIDSRDVLEGALSGMFSVLDEHSQYMDPRTLESLNKDTGGSFSGIGIHITQRQGLLTVIAPIPGSPSAKIGLMPWDRIIEIEGETTEGMDLTDAVDKLTGPAGTQVTIKVYREGVSEPLDFTITRANIKIDSVYYRMMDDGIGYLRIAKFSENTAADLRKAVLDMKSQSMNSLVLDLRFNTGGLLREAIEVSDLFVPKHELIVSTKGRLRSQNREYRAQEDPLVNLPVFVLVNEGSASASEIVAGALQDHHLAVIVGPAGKNTFGKGSVQTIEPLRRSMYEDEDGNPMDSALRITTARYYTPSGRTIHHIGITPDIGVPLPKGHEGELLRHGLYGDTTIPITKEEREAMEQREREALQEENPEKSNSENGVILQNGKPEGETKAIDSETGEPFYASAKRPETVEDNFTDIMLDEAVKQMKIYMILDSTRKDRPTIAVNPNGDSVSMAQ